MSLPTIDRKVYMVFDDGLNVYRERIFNTFAAIRQHLARLDRRNRNFPTCINNLKVIELTLSNPILCVKPIPSSVKKWCEENGYELKKKGD